MDDPKYWWKHEHDKFIKIAILFSELNWYLKINGEAGA